MPDTSSNTKLAWRNEVCSQVSSLGSAAQCRPVTGGRVPGGVLHQSPCGPSDASRCCIGHRVFSHTRALYCWRHLPATPLVLRMRSSRPSARCSSLKLGLLGCSSTSASTGAGVRFAHCEMCRSVARGWSASCLSCARARGAEPKNQAARPSSPSPRAKRRWRALNPRPPRSLAV